MHPNVPTAEECDTAIYEVGIGYHLDRNNFLSWLTGEFHKGNCRPRGECCDEPHYYWCDVLKKCHPVEKECCHECDHFTLNYESLEVTSQTLCFYDDTKKGVTECCPHDTPYCVHTNSCSDPKYCCPQDEDRCLWDGFYKPYIEGGSNVDLSQIYPEFRPVEQLRKCHIPTSKACCR